MQKAQPTERRGSLTVDACMVVALLVQRQKQELRKAIKVIQISKTHVE
jgi:hypothetical protein